MTLFGGAFHLILGLINLHGQIRRASFIRMTLFGGALHLVFGLINLHSQIRRTSFVGMIGQHDAAMSVFDLFVTRRRGNTWEGNG